jgi:hypothetical protein
MLNDAEFNPLSTDATHNLKRFDNKTLQGPLRDPLIASYFRHNASALSRFIWILEVRLRVRLSKEEIDTQRHILVWKKIVNHIIIRFMF